MANILVIDDDPAMRRMIDRILTGAGHQVTEAVNGVDGMKKFRAAAPEIVVTDIVMPGGMNGVELVQWARALRPELKVIYSSGFPADVLAERSMALVDGPLLHKPYLRTQFAAIVESVMEAVQA